MLIQSNAIIRDLLALHTALDNKNLSLIEELFEYIMMMLDPSQPFNDIEPITDATKKAIADAGCLIEKHTTPEAFLMRFIGILLCNGFDQSFGYVILLRTIESCHLIPQHQRLESDRQNRLNQMGATPPSSTSLSEEAPPYQTSDEGEINSATSNTHEEEDVPTPPEVEKNKSEVDIITELTQNLGTPENDSEKKAGLLHALFTRTIDAAAQKNIIALIKETSKTHPGCLVQLKQTINYYLTSNEERLTKATTIRTNKTSHLNGLLFIEHIGQTHFKINTNGHFLEALDTFAKGKPLKENMYADFGLFRPTPATAAPTPSKPFTLGSKI